MNPLNHVAIIMDGNGRWGLKHKRSRNEGHRAGLFTIEKILKETEKNKINFLTLYTFSTENWKRPYYEINYLFKLLEDFLSKKIDNINDRGIRIKVLGQKKFSKKLNKILSNCEKLTKNNKKLQINLALNYGSRSEILNAMRIMVKKKLPINEKNLKMNLYSKNIPDPDILIRTGNTNRLSNFLLWQISYTEIFFHKKLWPDFNEIDYRKIINSYKTIKRNYGSL